jgi:magnesium-transporting ATPase (P-type)
MLSPLDSNYGYRPSISLNGLFLALFLAGMLTSAAETIFFRAWWMIPVVIGATLEAGGYSARVYATGSVKHLFEKDQFLAQVILTVIAPTFFSAVNYTVLGLLVDRAGRKSSVLGARHGLFTVVFVTCDVISLIIQSVGGAMASIADNDGKDTAPGTHTMVAGIAFQTVTMFIFLLLFVEYIVKHHRRSKDWRPTDWKVLVYTLFASSMLILIRSIYRVVELAQGWRGTLITHEVYLFTLDSMLMVLFVYSHVLVFPPRYLRNLRRDDEIAHEEDIKPQFNEL